MAVRTLADIYGPFDREAKRRKLTQLTSPSNTLETAVLKSHELLSSISTNTTLDANSIENAQENQGTKGTDDHCGVVAADVSANRQSAYAEDRETGKQICFGMVSHYAVPPTDLTD